MQEKRMNTGNEVISMEAYLLKRKQIKKQETSVIQKKKEKSSIYELVELYL
ncbi:MAG: hypothetical protein R3Y58_00395 [Eubacteriales bacterium]